MGSLGAILDQYFALFVQGPRGQFSWRGQYQNGTQGPSSVWAEPPRPRGVPQDLRAVCHYQGSILVYLFFAKISELFFYVVGIADARHRHTCPEVLRPPFPRDAPGDTEFVGVGVS